MGRPASGQWRAEPRSEPDSGHPTVRDRRGALGDVTHGEPRNPTRKSKERLWSLLAYRCARPGSIPTTRTSGSVGGQGQQRPWSTRPRWATNARTSPPAPPGLAGTPRPSHRRTPRRAGCPASHWPTPGPHVVVPALDRDDCPGLPARCHRDVHQESSHPPVAVHVGMDVDKNEVPQHDADRRLGLAF